jgi:hypothetical protein
MIHDLWASFKGLLRYYKTLRRLFIMQNMNPDALMRQLDEILDESNTDYNAQAHAREVKKCVKWAEQYGGTAKVAVGRIKNKVALYSENKVIVDVEEFVFTGDSRGTQKHEGCFIEADNAAGVAAIHGTLCYHDGYVAVDRKTRQILAAWED